MLEIARALVIEQEQGDEMGIVAGNGDLPEEWLGMPDCRPAAAIHLSLTREADESDQRSKRIHLTAEGRAAIKAIRDIVGEIEAEWREQRGPREFAQLRNLLTQLHAVVAATNQPA